MGITHVSYEGWLADELDSKTDSCSEAFNLDPDRDRDVQPVKGTKEELEE